jgi:hypothetical protein
MISFLRKSLSVAMLAPVFLPLTILCVLHGMWVAAVEELAVCSVFLRALWRDA